METLRLRGIQQPSAVERLLDNFIARSNLLPKNCYQIRDPDTLPPQLQRVVLRETERGHTWACWADPFNTWFFTCEMSLPSSRERATPVLLVSLYDEAGALKESASWMADPEGQWHRCIA